MDKALILKMLDGISAQIETLKGAITNLESTVAELAECQHPRAVSHQTYSGLYSFCPDCNADLSASVGVSGEPLK